MKAPAGVCRMCGCSHYAPCRTGCAWIDRSATLCSECKPAADAEAKFLRTRAPAHARAFHLGFVVGWFKVRTSNPYDRHSLGGRRGNIPTGARGYARAWDAGKRAGAESARTYTTAFGPILNGARPAAYQRSAA